MVMTVEWYDAHYTSASVVEHGNEVMQDDGETLVTGEAAVVISGDSAAVVEGAVQTLLQRFRFVVTELEQLQVTDRSMHLEQNLRREET